MGQCANYCASNGGVKSCAVTKGSRPTVRDGYPTREPYVVPGSMSCICNGEEPPPNTDCGESCEKSAVSTFIAGVGLIITYICISFAF